MKVLAIDIGGTSIKSSLIDEQYEISLYLETDANNENMPKGIVDAIKKYSCETYDYVAVSATGVIDKSGKVVSTNGKLGYYEDLDIKRLIENITNKYTIVCNDVNAIGYAQCIDGKGDDYSLVVALGTGIGGCLIFNNLVLEGANGAFAEIGQLNINGQKFEDIASTKALITLANDKYNLDVANGIEFFQILNKDLAAKRCLDEWVRNLSLGIKQLLYAYNPKTIIIAGGISKQSNIIIPKLKEKLKTVDNLYTKELSIIAAKTNNDAGMIGAVKKLRSTI